MSSSRDEYQAVIERYRAARAEMDTYTDGPQNYATEEGVVEDELGRRWDVPVPVEVDTAMPRLLAAQAPDQGERDQVWP